MPDLWRRLAASVGPWFGLVLLCGWMRWQSPWLLPLAAGASLLWTLGPSRRSRMQTLGVGAILAGAAAGFAAHADLARHGPGWEAYWTARQVAMETRLDAELTALWETTEGAADRTAAATDSLQGGALDAAVRSIRAQAGLAGVAVYDADGRLVSWDGVHRGTVPSEVSLGLSRFAYGESLLFSYLYATALLPGGRGTAMAAALLRAELPPGLQGKEDDFASRFRRATGEAVRIFQPNRASADPPLDFRWDDRTLFSLALVRPAQAERRQEALRRWIRTVAVLVGLGWLLLAGGGFGRPLQRPLAGSTLLVLAAALPLTTIVGRERLPPADFLLPGPLGLGLVRVAALCLAGAVVAGMVASRREGRSVSPVLAVGLPIAVLFPIGVWLLRSGVSGNLLTGPEPSFLVFQGTLSLLLTLVAWLAFQSVGAGHGRRRATASLAAGVAIPPLLMAYAAVFVRQFGAFPTWTALLWAFPAVLIAVGIAGTGRKWRTLPRWFLAVYVGATAGLTYAWSARTEARIEQGQNQLERLASPVDPYLEFLLHRFGARAIALDAEGAGPVEVLYRSWVQSGLAEEGYPVWLTLWSPGNRPEDEFRIGVSGPRPPGVEAFLGSARVTDTVFVRDISQTEADYVAVAPLGGGAMATAVVPPRREVRVSSPLSSLFSPVQDPEEDAVTLVPLLQGDTPTTAEEPRWRPTPAGWSADMLLATPGQLYDAHYNVTVAAPLVLSARATLAMFLNVTLFMLVWGLGRSLSRGLRFPAGAVRMFLSQFRARISIALFGFFLISIVILGTVAFQALSTAATRAAEVLANRVTDDAAGWYNEAGGGMERLALRVRSDLLEYRDGALREGSVEELVRLGLYEGWIPMDVYGRLSRRESVQTLGRGALGEWDYVTSYRRLPDGDVLGAPISLQAGAIAVRRREVLDLLGFAIIVGGALSLGLALLVGRALARPLLTLQVASERVGSGNLRLRLPEERTDEFGSVFVSFNRMVERLRRARRDLVRTTRRTEAIVEEAATGVVALDPSGRVTVVNPRAEAFLGRRLPVGKPLEEDGGPADELIRWVHRYFRDGVRESGTDLQFGERRLRVRARRIARRGPLGGAVLSLEDVTDELRTERILAWGEMAQQVAHEVKNPLTPIKLSVQHIRRAWDDRRADFDAILSRNVTAILGEIDRLASIARSFSRLGAPRAAGEDPLEAVSIEEVVGETLALYEVGEGAITFTADLAPGLPPVTGRSAELKEVLINLLENARAAIPDRGVVRVEASADGDAVELRVVDDGAGIPPELLARIFEPHFSTRSGGTGLGLAIVRRLVDAWGGTVQIRSREGAGTTVCLRLVRWEG